MTQIWYECKDVDGNELRVNTYPEAEVIKKAGGSYKKVLDEVISTSEAYARKGARRAGDLR